jgi:putative holliday junction resolvase
MITMVRGTPERQPGTAALRVLAIDYGRKRIGLALSDAMGMTAHPLAVLSRTNRRNDVRRLRELCREHSVGRIVVGHPVEMGGDAGEMADEASRFAARLEKELGLPTELLDERLTSWEAEHGLPEAKSARRKGAPVDDLAAAILLREYLEKSHERSSTAGGL